MNMNTKARYLAFALALAPLTLFAACKGAPAGSSSGDSVAKDAPLTPLVTAAGLPVRQFYLHTELEPGKAIDTEETFSLDGVEDGHLFQTGVDVVRSRLSVKEADGSMNVITPRAAVYVEPNVFASPFLRALCATEVTVIDRGKAPTGHAYSYDTKAGSRLLCWVNVTSGAKNVWQEIEVASSVDDPNHDMFWSFALTGSRTEPTFDVVYAEDAEWQPQYFHAVGRTEREKGFERTIAVGPDRKASLAQLVDGEFPDFTILQSRRPPGADACQHQCGMVWDGSSWHACGGCASGEACIAGQCRAGKTCKPLTRAQACDAMACGKYSDGCGGQIDCGDSCPAGTVCGADGTFRRCGRRMSAKTADEIRGAYGDTKRQLCGVFADPATASTVDLGGCPDSDQTCAGNLCSPLRSP